MEQTPSSAQPTVPPTVEPVTPPIAPPTNSQATAPVAPQVAAANGATMGTPSSKGMLIVTVVALVIILGLVIGGAYWYMTYGQTNTPPPETTKTVETPAPTPTGDALDQELKGVQDASPGADFKKVDTDLNSL